VGELVKALNQIESNSALLIIAVVYVLFKVSSFAYGLAKENYSKADKDNAGLKLLLEKNITAVTKLETQITEVEKRLEDVKKLKKDLRRYYKAIKHLAGDSWPEISKMILEEEEFLNTND
jgi:hypothetical protein